ncbi:hypothetical protein OTU49_014658, partial [Cherax quadricarinatus]
AVLLIRGGRREFQGLLVISNKKLYILEIIAQEDDNPQTWLELHSSYNLPDVATIYSLYQRQGLALSVSETVLLISLADSHRANCFFNFFSEVLDECGIAPGIEECTPCQEEALTQNIHEAIKSSGKASVPSIFAIVSLLLDGGCSESQFLAINETDLVLFHADLEWYLPPKPEPRLNLNLSQKISDITAIARRRCTARATLFSSLWMKLQEKRHLGIFTLLLLWPLATLFKPYELLGINSSVLIFR